jgi:hypothetical protein
LQFLHQLRRARLGNFKSKNGTSAVISLVAACGPFGLAQPGFGRQREPVLQFVPKPLSSVVVFPLSTTECHVEP